MATVCTKRLITVHCAVLSDISIANRLWLGWHLWSAGLWQVIPHTLPARDGRNLRGSCVHRLRWYLTYSTDAASVEARHTAAGLCPRVRHYPVLIESV